MPTIVVAERGLVWLAAIRTCIRRSPSPQAPPAYVRVSPGEGISAALARAPAAAVVVEVTRQAAAGQVLQLEAWRGAFPAACFVVALDQRYAPVAERAVTRAMREAGAAYVLASPRRVADVLPLWARHWADSETPPPDVPAAWGGQSLPAWSRLAVHLPACWTGDF